MAGKHGDTINIEAMVQSKRKVAASVAIDTEVARLLRGAVVIAGLTLVGLPALAQTTQTAPSGNQPRPTQTGPSSGYESSPVAGAQQQLYTASGQNGAQVSQDPLKAALLRENLPAL